MSTIVELGSMLDSDPNHRGGRPFIAGTRKSVDKIAVMHAWGYAPEKMAYEHDLTMAQVYAALAFYLLHKDEIDDDLRRADEEYDRLADAWKRGVQANTPEWEALLNPGPFPTEHGFGAVIETGASGPRLTGTESTVESVGALHDAGRSADDIAASTMTSVARVFAALAVHEASRTMAAFAARGSGRI